MSEWNLKLNEPNTVENLTMGQKRMIGLAEQAESYIKREQKRRSENGQQNTQTGLENRQSKQKRINEAIAEHT